MEQDETIKKLRAKAMRLPLSPGVYLMKNSSGKIIYVGKAKALKNRVSQYFGSPTGHSIKVRKMVENVADFDFIMTDSEFEALVLECSLIKQHSPKYNILLKDDKGYQYIRITRGAWRKISAVKQLVDDGAEYLGPYTASRSVSGAVDEARKIFRLPSCSKQFPKDIGVGRPCLNYYIAQCSAPCAGKIGEREYEEAVADAIAFLRSGGGEVEKQLRERMAQAAEALDFEKAAKLRDRISAIEKIKSRQKVVCTSVEEQDVFALAEEKERACLNVLRFSNGRLFESEYFILDRPDDLSSARRELILSYYNMRSRVPKRISLDGEVEDAELLGEWLSLKAGHAVSLCIPLRGEQAELVAMCRRNAAEKLAQESGREGKSVAALDELARLLGLASPPEYIEAYDISHTAGSDIVAGMVVFEDGRPLKKAYRRFEIKGLANQDDYASLAQVISRRLARYESEKESGEGFGRLPDLILLDGGVGQVSAVLPVLRASGLDIPLFGMVKDNRHRTRAIAGDGGEIALMSKRSAFTLVSVIQEEVHRFAIDYHRKKRKKNAVSMTLTSVEGIGETRARELLKRFGSIKAISNAEVEELATVKGMTRAAAENIYNNFHSEENQDEKDKA